MAEPEGSRAVKVGVVLTRQPDDLGGWLADGTAFEAAGADALCIDLAPEPEFDHQASVIYYKVADLPATHAELVARDVKFEAAPHLIAKMADHDLWMAFLRDSEGNLLGLMSEVAR